MKQNEIEEWMVFGRPFKDGLEQSKFEYKGEYNSINEAVENLDSIFTKQFTNLKEENEGKEFALGLSGGWDSRLVLYYSLKVGIKPHLFFMGNPRMRAFARTNCLYAARKICQAYKLDEPKVVRFNSLPNTDLIKGDLKKGEYGFYHIWRYHTKREDIPDHNILLAGLDGGESFGQSVPKKEMDPFDTAKYILKKFGKIELEIPGILTEDDHYELFNKLHDYCNSFDNQINAVQSFLYGFYSRNNSIFDAYSPFHSKEYREETKKWKPEWLKDLKMQKTFFNKIMPKMASIPSQKPYPPFIKYQNGGPSRLDKLYYKYMRLIRGSMTNYDHVVYNEDFRKFMQKIFANKNEEFSQFFDAKDIIKMYPDFAHYNCKWFLNLIKIKIYFDEIK